MKESLSTYFKVLAFAAFCLYSYRAVGQNTGIVIDAGTQRRMENVQVITNTNKIFTTNYRGEFNITVPFSSVTFYKKGYMARSLTNEELRMDTILLLPLSVELDDVVITAKRPRVGFPFDTFSRQVTMGYPKPSGHDFLSIFQRHKVSKKERKRRQDAIDNY